MDHVIIDSRTKNKVRSTLLSLGFSLIELPVWDRLQAPVSAHPDMLLFISGKKILTHADYYRLASDAFKEMKELGYEIITSKEDISCDYPHDILFNALDIGGNIFCKKAYISSLISEHAKSLGKEMINVKQGYAKCSVARLNEKAAITADISLYKAMTAQGVDTLLISEGSIELDGYNYGFIGGCTGICGNTLYFSGSLDKHPDASIIKDFCQRHKISPVSLSDEALYDGGGLIFI